MRLAGSPGPHVFVESLTAPELAEEDLHHLTRVLRLRAGEPLTVSDGQGRWCPARLGPGDDVEPTGPIIEVAEPMASTTVAFSLVKGGRPELIVQKLTELGVDRIVALAADRSVVKWDDEKVSGQLERWNRIAREASMQSHRVRLPRLEGVVAASDFLSRSDTWAAHFEGGPLDSSCRTIAVGPEGGWTPAELERAGPRTVTLGDTVLRTETAAIAAGTLLCAHGREGEPHPS